MIPCALCAAAADTARDIEKQYDYLNGDSGYRICVMDEEELLDDKKMLVETVKPLTDYCTVIFWSCAMSEDAQEAQVDEWQSGAAAKDSFIIVLNMEENIYMLYTSGAAYRTVPSEKLSEISDSLHRELKQGDTDGMAISGFSQVYAAFSGEPLPKPVTDAGAVRYENPDTGYQAMILDDADLLTEEEEADLVLDMQPITEYGHIIFWSTRERASDAEIQAREKRYSYYGYDSAGVFAINMTNRKVVFHADGAMYEAVSASDARSITDNVSHYASEKNYYACAKEAYHQVLTRLKGQAIAEPMKITSGIVIGLMLAFVTVVWLAFGVLNPLNKKNKHPAKIFGRGALLASEPDVRRTGSGTRTWVTVLWIIVSSFGRGGGSSGGSSSGGGGGGSSGGGGGGSSSF